MFGANSVVRWRAAALRVFWATLVLLPVAAIAQDKTPDVDGAAESGVAKELKLTDSAGGLAGAVQLVADEKSAATRQVSKSAVLIGSFTVFLLAVFVGFEVIAKVPPTLHTPLMSGSNAISGITVVGAILTAGHALGGFGSFMGMIAVILAMINVVGGFLVTHRMLIMFKKR